jgi:hypothetical protein
MTCILIVNLVYSKFTNVFHMQRNIMLNRPTLDKENLPPLLASNGTPRVDRLLAKNNKIFPLKEMDISSIRSYGCS